MTNFTAIEKWYSGKALEMLRSYVIPTLRTAESDGFWPKGASRKVKAALNKQTVAIKYVRALEKDAKEVPHPSDKYKSWQLLRGMMFGLFGEAERTLTLTAEYDMRCMNETHRGIVDTVHTWALDFAPVAELVTLLDASRPRPVLFLGTLSRSVLDNVGRAMGIEFDTITVPKVEWTWIEVEIKGQKVRMPYGRILWPEGTRHGVSVFARGTAHNVQCHACGHAIKNPYNWVPLYGSTKDGPVSLWLGRDCAQSLLGCDVTGDAEYVREEPSTAGAKSARSVT